ncbi:MAG: hypothetical protein PF486_02135 [Prolixibacteraceae bacterium]|nr:hypothetical protein [Prolixibacteraceae bacterium]
MERVIHESITAAINVRVTYNDGSLLFEGSGKHAGMEMVGNLDLLK